MTHYCLSCGRGLPAKGRNGPHRKLCGRAACRYKRQHALNMARRAAVVARPVPVLLAKEAEVRRWETALKDAVALGLTHLIAGRTRRLAEARRRLNGAT